MSAEPEFVRAFGYVKKAAALSNRDLGVLNAVIADALVVACGKLIAAINFDLSGSTRIGRYARSITRS